MKTKVNLLLALVLACCTSATHAEHRVCTHVHEEYEQSLGYCSSVRIGDTLYLSGIAAAGPMEAAIDEVYNAVQRVLAKHNLSLKDIVHERVYTTNLDAFKSAAARRKAFYGDHNFPAATWVQVERLFTPDLVLEVQVIAVFEE